MDMKKLLLIIWGVCLGAILQAQVSKTVQVTTAGTLSNLLTKAEDTTVTNLTIIGNIDSRDFRTMRDSMPRLAILDLSNVTIVKYIGTFGTSSYSRSDLNTIPDWAFYSLNTPNTSLISIKLPKSLISIYGHSFQNCNNLKSIYIPSSVNSIDIFAFAGCSAYFTVDSSNKYFSSQEGILFNKSKTTLIQCPTSISGNYIIPSTVTIIGDFAFVNNKKLTSIFLPKSIDSIGNYAFLSCQNLLYIYCSINTPINISSNLSLFAGVNDTNCILYVPNKSVSLYQQAKIWQKFLNIDSISNTKLVTHSVTISNFANNESNVIITLDSITWNATSKESWITLFKDTVVKGNLMISALKNPFTTSRSALVFVTHSGIIDSITITQPASDSSITISQSTFEFNDTILTKKVFISANTPWSASADVSWLTISPAKGTGSDSITITAQANTTNVARTGTVTITSQASVTLKAAVQQTITVTQAANSGTPIVEITNERITIYPNPANSILSVNTNANIEIYNSKSQLILTTKAVSNEPNSLKDIPSGVYFVKIITASGVVTKSLVVE